MAVGLRFKSVIKMRGMNPYVFVSKARASTLKPGWKRPLPVLVRINGHPRTAWPINLMPTGLGSFYLYLHGKVRKASESTVGDRVEVEIRFNARYKGGPETEMPEWFEKPLSRNAQAKKAWLALSPSRQKEITRYFTQLKSTEAQTRNVKRALEVLSGEEGRFMARTWKGGA